MQDYHIYTHYAEKQNVSKTSPKHVRVESRTKAVPENQKEKSVKLNAETKNIAMALGTTMKINQYVGEFTENTISAGRYQVAASYAGMMVLGLSNPALALGAAATFTANKIISYNIKVNKENLSANFMRQLSGGTVKTRG